MKRLLLFLLSIAGISVISCVDYGVPYATFELKGNITDTLNNPIENIQVSIDYDATTSDAEGNYGIAVYTEGTATSEFLVKVEDIDGEENGGEFQTHIISLPVKESDYVGKKKDSKWDMGKATKEVNFKLIKKQNDE